MIYINFLFILHIEAMKMQNSLTSPVNGKIKHVFVKKGNTVGKDDLLLEMD